MIGTADLSQLPGRANPIYLEGKIPPLTVEQARQFNLKNQEIVEALVRAREGGLELLIRGRSLSLPPGALAPGWLARPHLLLRVQQTAQGDFGLVPVDDAPPSAPAAASFFSRVGNLLFRPPQMGQLAELYRPGMLDAMLRLAGRPDLNAQWRGMQLSMAQLNPQALGQAMAAAMGSEVWLARGQPPPADDPKQLLRRLAAALGREERADAESLDGEGLEGLGTLNRAIEDLEASQVQAVQAQAQREVLFTFVLPFVDADPVQLQFRRAPRQPGGEAPPLTVNVHSVNQDLGEIWLKTQLHGLDRVDLTMWALKESVVVQARERSGELGAQLADSGLAMQSFQVIHGPRNDSPQAWQPSGRGLVVDISA